MRKYFPAEEQGVAHYAKLFEMEKEYSDQQLSFEERKQQRQEGSNPVLDAMAAWINTGNAVPNPNGALHSHTLTQNCFMNTVVKYPSSSSACVIFSKICSFGNPQFATSEA